MPAQYSAKSLRSGQTKTIGILVEDIRGLPVFGIVSGIQEILSKSGYRMLLYDLHLRDMTHNQYGKNVSFRARINAGMQSLLQA